MKEKNIINDFIEFTDAAIEQSIIDRFCQQVELYPDRIAIRDGDQEATYTALNGLANSIANYLLELNVLPESRVGILMDHGVPFISSIFGVLKAGCAYLPLDPMNNRQRNMYQLQDAGAEYILVDNQDFSAHSFNKTIEVGVFEEISKNVSSEEVKLNVSPTALACILYTSGTSGKPKGASELHRNILNNIRNYTNVAKLSRSDVHTLLHICSFGASRLDIFGALLNGATLSLIDLRKISFSEASKIIQEHSVTVFHSTPTLFKHILQDFTGEKHFSSVRLIHLGSESVKRKDYELYRKKMQDNCMFLNRYGTTETGTISLNLIDKNTKFDGQLVPSGWPVDNMEIIIIDSDGKSIKNEKIGEVVVKSSFLSPGYWNQPLLTEKYFVSNDASGVRFYKTGDLGSVDKTGMLTLLGRKDNQIKIKGFRVEIQEVEKVLESLDMVNNALVKVYQGEDDEMVAFIVPSTQNDKVVEIIREKIRELLPEYKLPHKYVCIEIIPITANGKLNFEKLNSYYHELKTSEKEHNNSQYAKLRELWRSNLGVNEFDNNNSFYSLGGDSLRALKIISGIKSEFGLSISLLEFMDAENLSGLIKLMENKRKLDDNRA